jgi:hypothetical protein
MIPALVPPCLDPKTLTSRIQEVEVRSTFNVRFRDRSGRKTATARKLCRPDQIIAKLRKAEVPLGQGKKVPERICGL